MTSHPTPPAGSMAAGAARYRAKHPAPARTNPASDLANPALRAEVSAAADQGDRAAADMLAAWHAAGGDPA